LPEIYKPIKEDWIDKVIESIEGYQSYNWNYIEDIRLIIEEFMPKACITSQELKNMSYAGTYTVTDLLQLLKSKGLLKN